MKLHFYIGTGSELSWKSIIHVRAVFTANLFALLFLITGMFVSAGITPDTAYVSRMFLKGKQWHYDQPDSALYFYGMIINQFKEIEGDFTPPFTELDEAYLETLVRAMNQAGNIYYYNDEFSLSESYFRQSLEIARMAGLKELTARALYDIGYTRYVNDHFAEASELFRESFRIYSGISYQKGMFNAMQAFALAQQHLGNGLIADSAYQEAFELAQSMGDSVLVADIRLHKGILLCEQGYLDEGIRLFEEALRFYELQDDDRAVSLALLNIGVVMKMIGEYEKALVYMNKSTEIEETRQQKSQLVIRYYNLADLFMEMGQNRRAYEYCLKVQVIADEIGSRPFEAENNFLIGKYYFQEGNFSEADRYFLTAYENATRKDNRPLTANILLWHSRNLIGQNQPAGAVKKALEAEKLAGELHLLSVRKDAAEVLSEAYENSGNEGMALLWSRRFKAYSDSLDLHDQYREIRRIEARYNFQEKERENELLRNRTSLQEQKLRNRNVITLALALVVALGLVIIFLLYKRSRDARLLYRQQQMLNLKHLEEMEQELDGKNRELTSKTMFLNQKNDLITRLIDRLQEIRDNSDNSSEEIVSIVNELRADSPQSSWKEFEAQFVQVHPGFYQRLYEKHPELTSYEQRICAFLRMNLNTKEISSISGRSPKSIEVTRSRIRTKLGLSRNDNLSSFLAAV